MDFGPILPRGEIFETLNHHPEFFGDVELVLQGPEIISEFRLGPIEPFPAELGISENTTWFRRKSRVFEQKERYVLRQHLYSVDLSSNLGKEKEL